MRTAPATSSGPRWAAQPRRARPAAGPAGEALPGPPARPAPQGFSHPSACGFPRDSAKERAPLFSPSLCFRLPQKRFQSFPCKVEINTKRALPFRGVLFACSPPRGTERQKNGSSFPIFSPTEDLHGNKGAARGGGWPLPPSPSNAPPGPAPPRSTACAFWGTSRSPEGRNK